MRKRSKFPIVTLALASALVLSACSPGGGSNNSGEVLRVGSSTVSTLDYTKSNYGYHGLGNLVLEPLVVIGDDGGFEPWLAESWSQTDETTYVYKLREGVKFSDGETLTSADVVTSLDYYRADGSLNAYSFPSSLMSIIALDANTVEFKFSEPYPAWNSTLSGASFGIFQEKHFDENKATFGQPGTGIVGTGPWKLDKLDATSGASLSTNPNYWGEKPPFSEVEYSFFSTETSVALAFRTGKIDVAFPEDARAFESTADTKLVTSDGGTDKVEFWMNVLAEPWDDVHVRRAVAYALDKEALLNASGAVGSTHDTVIPEPLLLQLGSAEEVSAALEGIAVYAPSLEKAKAEMALSAYPNGVTVQLATINEVSKVSQAVVGQLEAIGINATLETQTDEQNNAAATSGDRVGIPTQVVPVGGVSLDPGLSFDYMIGSENAVEGGWNGTNWSTPDVDRWRAEGLRESNPTKRLELYASINKAYADAMPVVPIFTKSAVVAVGAKYTWPNFAVGSDFNQGPWALALKSN